jgi:hypothetical protein
VALEFEDGQEVLATTGGLLTVPDDVPTMRLHATV